MTQGLKDRVILVYKGATLLGHKISLPEAIQIARRFTLMEMRRIVARIQNTGSRRIYAKEIARPSVDTRSDR